jgi:hypothetical protein
VSAKSKVVVDPAFAGVAEEGERPVVGIEHHLLRLTRIGPHERHPAVAQPDLRELHRHRGAAKQHHFLRPVELQRFAGREAQRDESLAATLATIAGTGARIAPDRVIAAP